MKKKFFGLFSLTLVLTIGIYLMTSRIYHLEEIYKDQPKEIVAVNITSSTAEIYWKSNHNRVPALSYLEDGSTALSKTAYVNVYEDNTSNSYIYISKILDLDPNTKYTFEIKSNDNEWRGDNFTFETKGLQENPELPVIATGISNPMDFILLEKNGEKYMLDTEYHGSWAIDLQDLDTYTKSTYGNYMPESQLATYTASLFGISKAYARSGANCKTGATASYGVAPKDNFVGIASRNLSGCPNAHYANECYERVVCQANKKGVDPAVVLSSWMLETTASSYDAFPNSPIFQDFGINKEDSNMNWNFENQLDWYLTNQMAGGAMTYVKGNIPSGCTYEQAAKDAKEAEERTGIDDGVILFSAKFSSGNICDTANGERYATSLTLFYKWITGDKMVYPFFLKTSLSGNCNFTGVNSTYNKCDGTASTGGSNNNNTGGTETPTTGTLACGNNGCTKDADCKGWETGDVECDETSSHNPSDQYCTRISCPAGQFLADDRCTCTDGEEYTIDLQAGINFVSFTENPYVNGNKVRAKSLMEKYSNIISIGEYIGGEWTSILTEENGEFKGENFRLDGGHAYLIITERDITITYNGLGTEDQDLSKVKGWTLVPTEKIGESSAQSIITSYEALSINQISVWSYPTSMFENLAKDVDGSFYGENISLDNVDTLFIKIE